MCFEHIGYFFKCPMKGSLVKENNKEWYLILICIFHEDI